MKTNVVWEDEPKNRVVNFEVDFSISDSELAIESILPTKVTFTCPVTNVALRSIGVHTENGRRLLSNRFVECGKLEELINRIADRNDLTIALQLRTPF